MTEKSTVQQCPRAQPRACLQRDNFPMGEKKIPIEYTSQQLFRNILSIVEFSHISYLLTNHCCGGGGGLNNKFLQISVDKQKQRDKMHPQVHPILLGIIENYHLKVTPFITNLFWPRLLITKDRRHLVLQNLFYRFKTIENCKL